MKYTKPALTFEKQIELLQSRGLIIENKERAQRWLARVSYYRLSAYFAPFKTSSADESFRSGTKIDSICDLYNFDRKLRLILLDAIERIEVAIRTAVTYELAHSYGPFGHTNPTSFSRKFDHPRFLSDLQEVESKSRERYIKHFRTKYSREPHIPIWMISELFSFGMISVIYSGLLADPSRRIASQYGPTPIILASWIHSLSSLRNVCAHHARLWNRVLGVQPKLPPAAQPYWPYASVSNTRLYAAFLILQQLLSVIAPNSGWKNRLVHLLDEYPSVDRLAMGFPRADSRLPWAGLC
jgi:abortive infection bacteriophage resistance protein